VRDCHASLAMTGAPLAMTHPFVIARLVLNEVKELDEAIPKKDRTTIRDCHASLAMTGASLAMTKGNLFRV